MKFTLETPEEIELWSRVYAAALIHPSTRMPEAWADRAVERLRERLPAEPPSPVFDPKTLPQ